MSVSIDDPVDVIYFILNDKIEDTNIGTNVNVVLSKTWGTANTKRFSVAKTVYVTLSGVDDKSEKADVFYNYENLEFLVQIDIECMKGARGLITQADKEVKRALQSARKINHNTYTTGGTTIRNNYDVLYLTRKTDNTNREAGIQHFTRFVQLKTRSKPLA